MKSQANLEELPNIRLHLEWLVLKPSEHRGVGKVYDEPYIDEVGILRFSPRPSLKRPKPKKRFVDMASGEIASPVKGIWYAFTVEPYTLSKWDSPYEMMRRKFQGQLGEVFYRPDTKTFHYATAKRQLGKREKKSVLA